MLARILGKGNHSAWQVGNQISTATVEISMKASQKSKDRTLSDPVIPLLGTYPEKLKLECSRDSCTPTFTVAQSTTAEIQNHLRCLSMDKWPK